MDNTLETVADQASSNFHPRSFTLGAAVATAVVAGACSFAFYRMKKFVDAQRTENENASKTTD